MSKTSKQEQVQNIDPQLREEADITTDAARMLAAIGYTPYTGNTIAAPTEGQKAAWGMSDAAASAFGMEGGLSGGVPEGTEGAYGIMGYSPETVMREESPISDDVQSALDAFYKQAGTQSTDQGPLSPSGGGKK